MADEPTHDGAVRTRHHYAGAAVIPKRFQSPWLIVAGAASLIACAGSAAALGQTGRPPPPGRATGGVLNADFESIQTHLLTPICAVCHAGRSAPQGLRLDAANSYALLVGVPSTEVPSILRVKPGDPGNSYIVQKLEGYAVIGAPMPSGGPRLPAEAIAAIREWISAGGLRSSAGEAARDSATVSGPPIRGSVLP